MAAEIATGIFDELHAPRELADAYWVLGSVLRRSGELAAAQTRLRLAIEVASTSRCVLSEAEATRELALVLAAQGNDGDAITLMGQAATELERSSPREPWRRRSRGPTPRACARGPICSRCWIRRRRRGHSGSRRARWPGPGTSGATRRRRSWPPCAGSGTRRRWGPGPRYSVGGGPMITQSLTVRACTSSDVKPYSGGVGTPSIPSIR